MKFEEAFKQGYIFVYPGNGIILFCSHRWLAGQEKPAHPDTQGNIKYTAVKNAIEQDPAFIDVEYVWVDFTCVPQESPVLQQLAINSLPYIIQQCAHFMVLTGESGVVNTHIGEDEASIEVYRSRGWCRLECISASVAKHLQCWKCNISTGKVEKFDELTSVEQFNPFLGNFCDMEDRRKIAATVFSLCDRPEYSEIKELAFKHLRLDAQQRFQAEPKFGCSGFELSEMTHLALLREHCKAARSFMQLRDGNKAQKDI